MSGPLVSIITPSYNQGVFIEETIKSVLSQDYPNIEYIVVDGGSMDNTVEILKKYEGRLRWISEKDRGQSDAINKGFRMSKGEILAWLNSDDTFLPGAVRKMAEAFNFSPDAGMIYAGGYYTDEKGNIVDSHPPEPFDREKLASSGFIFQPSTFFRREAFFGAGGLDESLHYTMDHDLWLKICSKHKVGHIEEFLSTYRIHGESKTMAERNRLEFAEESLKTIFRHYRRAPINRVYAYCYYLVKSKAPYVARFTPLLVFLAIAVSIVKYLRLNRGINIKDVKLLNLSNIRRLFSARMDAIKTDRK
ncbi:MAG: hypothetical protein A3G39_09695 [Deltaproteobacteria bacterium RIFCSPLOWO2_12_FULL_43_16]|nr:MAG: hypothetical protein A2Z89_06215 [Deltaproteobacteria bacterium GWA2_43_19]OGQ10978.1 MAG: hypothetical protein A3D30_01805 [Deltaproteobacteria bacterium RIFCSPHIGHO2_02_FULL_43_33]OGQ44833.1 MAG: hypothetical protein A3A85_06495 [Deltaproteobacteria bacterium RIFCSPLOWO2_01_FULL_42_9]OGQ60118.1 MAG: hypothetical protein A3G39_09695 [Deltaproteobacteria bacterium RIFCSPLOWO2_12_FULL_43_16]HBR16176.1 glycosyltransferase [Deltaproteobacteria bacterium]